MIGVHRAFGFGTGDDAGVKVERAIGVIYFVGLSSLLVAVTLHLARLHAANRLSEAKVLRRFGFLYKDFRTKSLYWGVVRLYKQALLVVVQAELHR